MNEEIEKLLSAMTDIEARLGQLSTVEETAKVKAELAELSKKQLGLAEEIRRLKQQQPGGSDNVSAPLTLGARVVADAGFLEFAAGKGQSLSGSACSGHHRHRNSTAYTRRYDPSFSDKQ